MWFNQTKCDIYMGAGAGSKLLKEIGNAQKSVKISSPYLSPKMVKELIYLHNQGIQISLLTSDTLNGGNRRQEKSVMPLIVQNRTLDARAQKTRNRWKLFKTILTCSSILLLVLFLALFFNTEDNIYLIILMLPVLLIGVSRILQHSIRRKRIFHYHYTALFPFKVFVTPDSNRINTMFIHGKIYIIDGHTAYLGSLNFTESGTKYNYETRIRVTELEAVQKIDTEFEELYHNPEMAFFGIEEWGSYLYAEPIN
jgi:phosphatidylserine/phosphatidylglycerophosphate/cardiolipin synthase-like enzyme